MTRLSRIFARIGRWWCETRHRHMYRPYRGWCECAECLRRWPATALVPDRPPRLTQRGGGVAKWGQV